MSVWDFLEGSRAADVLKSQIAGGEIAHAWLLLGPAGSGKMPAALALACALNCPVDPGTGCGGCSTCTRILKRRHPDVHHIVPEGPIIPVDVIRSLVVPEAMRSPFEGAWKVFVVEEAERMNPAAQNALLKTLEEPPADTVFVLISDREEDLLETIRSRCRLVHLEPVSEARIVELLVKYGTSNETAILAARLSDGDYEKARALATDPDAIRRRRVWTSIPVRLQTPADAFDLAQEILTEVAAAKSALQHTHKEELSDLADAVGEGRGTTAIKNAVVKRQKRELRRLEEEVLGEALSSIAGFYRDVVALRAGGGDALIDFDVAPSLDRWAAAPVGDDALVAAIARCLRTRVDLGRNANPTLAVEATLVELSRLVPALEPLAAGGT